MLYFKNLNNFKISNDIKTDISYFYECIYLLNFINNLKDK